jgi:hypothetical protein
MDSVVKTGVEYAEGIRQTAESAGKHEEKLRLLDLIDSFPQWNMSPNLGVEDTNKKQADREAYERMNIYKRVYDHARQKKLGYHDITVLCSRNNIPEDHAIIISAAVKFNPERLNVMINENQGITL